MTINSKRGIFMTNICNVDIENDKNGNSNGQTPPSDIDYIPTPGGLYKLSVCMFVFICSLCPHSQMMAGQQWPGRKKILTP